MLYPRFPKLARPAPEPWPRPLSQRDLVAMSLLRVGPRAPRPGVVERDRRRGIFR